MDVDDADDDNDSIPDNLEHDIDRDGVPVDQDNDDDGDGMYEKRNKINTLSLRVNLFRGNS